MTVPKRYTCFKPLQLSQKCYKRRLRHTTMPIIKSKEKYNGIQNTCSRSKIKHGSQP